MAEAAVIAGLGWVASPVITKLVNKSSSYLGSNITKDLEDLETILQPQIQLTIEAAEHSPHKAQFARWLARLKNAYFDAEAILHDLEYERLKHKAQEEDKKLLVSLSSKPIIKPIVKKASLFSQKRKLLKRLKKLKEVAAEAKTLRELLSTQNIQSTQNASDNPFATTSLLGNADRVFGRDGDREKIIKFLLDEQGGSSSSTKSYSVIAITGMGGVGKTTLAQLVYNDERVKKYFGVRMWICLSQNMDIIEHTKEMIEFASGKRPNLNNLSKLQEELVQALPDNIKVMVVLDNVWYDNNDGAARENQWEILLKPFDSRGGTCKIVVTSRQNLFPIDLQPGKIISLSDLAPDDFRSLLRYRAIDGLQIKNPQMENDVSDIVNQIAEKMSKLPLAAKIVGNQLRQQPYITFWRATLGKVKLSNIVEILLWSFRRLDIQLQRCFLFCSVFPKGTKFINLISNWVALDFIQPSNDSRTVEDVGLEYFQIMEANSIFHLVDNKYYIMHDLFHDLAEELSVGDCFKVTKAERNIPERREIPSTVQHIWLEVNNENLKEYLSSIRNLSNLRTFILVNQFIDDISEIIQEISTNFRNLRVLQVYSKGYKILPRAIGDLRNLRFVYFGGSSIEKLPVSVLQLYHLQYVWLPSSLKTLPTKLRNFIKLRSINMCNSDGSQAKTLPPVPYLGKLTSLQSLNEFHVSKEKGFELQQLEPLKEIHGSLRIVNLENVRDKNEAGQANLVNKSKLQSLELVWTKSAENGSEIVENDLEIIEALQPPENLVCLTINGYRGSTCNPIWLEEGSYIKDIQDVRFYNCNALTNLPQNFHQFRHCSHFFLENLGALRALSTFPENLARLSILRCPSLIFVYENELQVNENQSIMEQFFQWCLINAKEILDDELKSFEQTGSKENCVEQFRIIERTAQGNAPEDYLNVNRAWWSCHQQRMNFIFRCSTRANKLELPTWLRILHLCYCCVSDGALSNCLIGMIILDKLYLSGVMTITTLPPAQVLKSLQSLLVLEITDCWYLSSLGGLHALPLLNHFVVKSCFCLTMDSNLPPTLQSLTIIQSGEVTRDIFNGNFRFLEHVEIFDCHLPSSLSFTQLTSLELLALDNSTSRFSIHGLESRPHISTLHLVLLPNLDVESVLQSWQGCQTLWISNSELMSKLLSSQNFDPPRNLGIKYCDEEEISFEESNHLGSIKALQFYECKTKNLPITLSGFSTLEAIHFHNCRKISRLPELPGSVKMIKIKGCPVLRERCLPNGSDWNKIQHIQYRDIE